MSMLVKKCGVGLVKECELMSIYFTTTEIEVMSITSKKWALSFIVLVAVLSLALLVTKPVNAQTIPTPSVPDFSLEYVNTSYFSSPITTTDPYTGQNHTYSNTITERGVVVTIKNQPYTQPLDSNGLLAMNQPCLFYLFQWKGHYSTTWTNSSLSALYPEQNSTYIVDRLGMDGNSDDRFGGPIQLEGITDGGKLDFQVQAFIGYYEYIPTPTQLDPFYQTSTAVFVGQSSGWSDTQTIDIINGSTTTSIGTDAVSGQSSNQSPASTTVIPELFWSVIVALLLSAFAVAVIVRYRKNR